jgi:5-methylthioadenosine/S-adenosylhomocysteine deaminase
MTSTDLLIRNATILEPDSSPVQADIAVTDGRIVRIGSHLQVSAEDVLEASHLYLTAGLINCHAHSAMVFFRGAVEDVTPERWFNDYIWRMETNLTAEDVYWGTLLAALEMIESGVTTVADHYFFADSVAQAFIDSGLRAHLAPTLFGQDDAAELQMARSFFNTWQNAANRLTVWLGPHSPYLCSAGFLQRCRDLANELETGIHLHVSETADQVAASLQTHALTPPAYLAKLGILDGPVLCAHAAHATLDDMTLLAERGASVAHCPKTFAKMALGMMDLPALLRTGVKVGLGTDGAASNNTLDVLEQARLTALFQKHAQHSAEILPVAAVISLLSRGGAAALGQGRELGRIQEGFLADFTLFDLSGAHTQPIHNPLATLLYSARSSDVDTVIVAGQVIYRHKVHRHIDKERVLAEVARRAPRLVERAHQHQMATYPE